MRILRIYDTYRKVKEVFAKPKVKVYFGLWKNDPNLPVWRKGLFYYCNSDVYCKCKYDSWRYEFPPQFTIVLFGISLTITLHCPIEDKYSCDDHYWECILEYLYGCGNQNVKDTLINCGYWKSPLYNYWQLRKEYLKKEYWPEYTKTRYKWKKEHKHIKVE